MINPFDTDNLPTNEPLSIIKGQFVSWRREIDYTGVSVKYVMKCVDHGAHDVTVTGVQDGKYWVFTLTAAETTAIQYIGQFFWELTLVRDSDSEEAAVERGYLDVFDTTTDRRTHAEIMVAKIELVLSGRADADVESYSIGSRSITKMSVKELREWREYYLAEISRSGGSTLNGGPKKNTVKVRFE